MSVFNFKQFSIDQSGCAMKINTDGVLLGALVTPDHPERVLDIGTGTGVIAMMLAQRFKNAIIDAIDIDTGAATAAAGNFKNSKFANRLNAYPAGFEEYLAHYPDKRYDLIISNPPFFLNSLRSTGVKKILARHTDINFFEVLIKAVALQLTNSGNCVFILPATTATLVRSLITNHQLHLQKVISVSSFANNAAHREILSFGKIKTAVLRERFVIYDAPHIYSAAYQRALSDFLTIF